MKEFKFDADKDKLLKVKRGISFRDVIKAIDEGGLVKIIKNPNVKKYEKQDLYLVYLNNYIYVVPTVEEQNYVFMKTIYPSRKYTKECVKKKL